MAAQVATGAVSTECGSVVKPLGCIIYLHVLVDSHVNAFVSIVNCFDSLLFSLALGTGALHPLHCDGRLVFSCAHVHVLADLFSHVTCLCR